MAALTDITELASGEGRERKDGQTGEKVEKGAREEGMEGGKRERV